MEREHVHPTIKIGDSDYNQWKLYFENHLGGFPLAFRRLLDASQAEMTVPERLPEWFDLTYAAI